MVNILRWGKSITFCSLILFSCAQVEENNQKSSNKSTSMNEGRSESNENFGDLEAINSLDSFAFFKNSNNDYIINNYATELFNLNGLEINQAAINDFFNGENDFNSRLVTMKKPEGNQNNSSTSFGLISTNPLTPPDPSPSGNCGPPSYYWRVQVVNNKTCFTKYKVTWQFTRTPSSITCTELTQTEYGGKACNVSPGSNPPFYNVCCKEREAHKKLGPPAKYCQNGVVEGRDTTGCKSFIKYGEWKPGGDGCKRVFTKTEEEATNFCREYNQDRTKCSSPTVISRVETPIKFNCLQCVQTSEEKVQGPVCIPNEYANCSNTQYKEICESGVPIFDHEGQPFACVRCAVVID